MREPELRKLMDALGRAEDDWQEADFAPLREAAERDPQVRRDLARIQAWDQALEQALEEAPIPTGLEQRLLAAVQAAEEAPAELPSTVDPSLQDAISRDADVTPARRPTVGARNRWWSYAAVAVAASLMLALAFVALPGWNISVTVAELTVAAEQTVADLPGDGWRGEDLPLETHPVDPSLRFSRQLVWRTVRFLGDRKAVVYRDPAAQRPVHLIVARAETTVDLPQLPPGRPQQLTGTYMVAAWKQADGLVSVLIFEGDLQRYQQLVRPMAVAFQDPARNLGTPGVRLQ